MNTRRTTLLIALVLAIGTGWLTLSYVSSLRSSQSSQLRQVLVTTQQIPARMTIASTMLHTETLPSAGLQPDALSDPTAAVGQVALVTIPAGSQLTSSQIGTQTSAALPVRLQPGMRAVSVPIDRVKGVSGLIQPGDRVDVIAIPPRAGDETPTAATILRGIRVLAIGNALESPSATPSPDEQNATTATLEVNTKQADLLAWADTNATLRLALRSPKEPIRSEPVEQLVFGKAPPPLPAPAPLAAAPLPPVAVAPVPRPAPVGVEVIVGDRVVGQGSTPTESDEP